MIVRGNDRRPDPGSLHALHVIAGLDEAHGGPSYSVPRLCEALAAADRATILLSVVGADGSRRDTYCNGYDDRRFAWDYRHVPLLCGLRWSSGLSRALSDLAPAAVVIHGHGLWLMPNVAAGWAAECAQKPLVVSPRGMLGEAALRFSGWKKRLFWRLLQGPVVRQAACLHATSQQEYEEIRAFGLTNPVAVIPNGIDVPEPLAEPTVSGTSDRVVLSLGRIHPKKALDRLIQAWARIEAEHPGWRLRIVGPGEAGYDNELRGLVATLGLAGVTIEGPIYGDRKFAAYRDADFFVLPTLNENFGLTVAEALASGTPAISTKGAPWSGLEAHSCGWWIDHGVEPLAAALTTAMAMPRAALKAMGAEGRAWMARDFSWDRVARDTLAVYRWLAGEAEASPTTRFD